MLEILGIIIVLVLVWLHHKSMVESFLKPFYIPFLLLKLAAGVGVGLLYTHYYSGGDTWSYFNQAKLFAEVGFSNSSNFINLFIKSNYELVEGFGYVNQPRAALMVKLVAIINLLSNSNYWISTLYFSFFSFIGIYKFSIWVVTKFEHGKVAALTFFVWPSFVFWSSGILKEALAVGLIFWIIPTFFNLMESKSVKKGLTVLIGLYLLFLIKYYFAAVLFVILLLYSVAVATKLQTKPLFLQISGWILMLVLGLFLGRFLHPNLRIENIAGVIIENYNAFSSISTAQSLIQFRETPNQWLWLVINTPKALLASLFLPLTFGNGLLFFIASLENWMLVALVIRGMFLIKFFKLKNNSILLLSSFSYIIILAVFLALSTPNLGTLSRYKVAFIPIVLVLAFLANRFSYFESKK